METPDPIDEPTPAPARCLSLVEQIIEGELHTDDMAKSAVDRLSVTDVPIGLEYWTGSLQALNTDDWVYGVNRRTVAPRKSGLNFSYNALFKGTAKDDEALPKILQQRYLEQTDTIVKKRRERARAISSALPYQDAKSRAIDESLGLVRERRGQLR